jgi:hypothetical protein
MSFQPKDINSVLTPAEYIKNTVMIATKIEQSDNGSSSMDNVRTVSENFTTTEAEFDLLNSSLFYDGTIGSTNIGSGVAFVSIIAETDLSGVKAKIAEYDQMKKKRGNLEEKMEEMENGDTDVNLQTESTVYTTLLITALGTSLLYFLFRKI